MTSSLIFKIALGSLLFPSTFLFAQNDSINANADSETGSLTVSELQLNYNSVWINNALQLVIPT